MTDLEATKLIPDLPNHLVEHVRKRLGQKLADGNFKPTGTHRQSVYYTFGDNQNGYVVLTYQGELIYFVRFRRVSYSGFSLGRQVLIWRIRDVNPIVSTQADGFAKKVFFNILLPKYGALIADQEQTRNGSSFWTNVMGLSIKDGLHVYCLDRRDKIVLTKLRSEMDIDKFSSLLWGNTNAHLRTFGVISNKPLVLRNRDDKPKKESL